MPRSPSPLVATLLVALAAPLAADDVLLAPRPATDALGRVVAAPAADAVHAVEMRLPTGAGGRELSLWLPDGLEHTARIDAYEASGGRVTFWGRIDPWRVEEGYLVATSLGGRTLATISLGERTWRVAPRGEGEAIGAVHERWTCGAMPLAARTGASGTEGASAVPGSAAEGAGAPPRAVAAASPSDPGPAVDAAAAPVVDVLVFYTPATRQAAGGDAAAALAIQHSIDYTNFAFANSGVTARLRLAAARPIEYQETGPNGVDDLFFLIRNPAVAAQREELGADLVGLVKSRWNDVSGVGMSMTATMKGAAIAPVAVFQTNLEHMPGNFAHEVGHNFGLQHEREEQGNPPAPLPYAHAFFLDGVFRTVMVASEGRCNCPRIPHYSNPRVKYGGVRTGVANQRDNARALRVLAPAVATFGSLRGRIVSRATAVTVGEGAAELVVDLYRVDGSIGAVTVDYSTRSGTAKAGQDFVATSGRLEWATGEADVLELADYGFAAGRRIVIPLLADGERERPETLWIDLAKPSGGARLGLARIKVTLADDD